MGKIRNLYEDLKVSKKTTPEQIKEAFRKMAKKTHPDKGGNAEEFRAIAIAYNILSDEEKRRRYDNGENPDYINQPNKDENQVLSMILTLFNSVVDQNIDLTHNNLFDIIKQSIQTNQQNFKVEKERNKTNIEKYNNILKRIKKKEKSIPFIQILDDKIRACNAEIIHLDESIKLCDVALKLIEGCEYETEARFYKQSTYYSTTT